MYGDVKTDQENKPGRVITSGCNTPVENLSIFVENAIELPSRFKNTCHMLEITDDINNSNLSSSASLVSFDAVNLLPSRY